MTIKADERIYETKNICGRYYAAEINGGEAARLLSLKGSGRVSSRVAVSYTHLTLPTKRIV